MDGLGIYEDGAVNGVDADGRFGVGHDLDAAGYGGDGYARLPDVVGCGNR